MPSDIYNPNGMSTAPMYPEHHHHHGSVMRNVNPNYQPLPPPPKHYSTASGYPGSESLSLSSCDYQPYNYRYKNGEIPTKIPKPPISINAKQFKTFNHFEPPHPPNMNPHMSHYAPPPQYHTMQVKHPEKIKISIDLEEQINSSKIPKMRESQGYGYYQHPAYYPYHRPTRTSMNGPPDPNDPKIANINISLRDFLSSWNEIDDDEDGNGSARAQNGIMDDMNNIEHMERTIMREYNPMFVQKATDNLINVNDVPAIDKSQLEMESAAISEGTEKLYVLETIDVPISELNKYKHLSIINKLPENVVITDKELYNDMEMNREKLYKSEFELEFEACQEQQRKITKEDDSNIPTVEIKSESDEEEERKQKMEAAMKKVEVEEEKIKSPIPIPIPVKQEKIKKPLKPQKLKKVEVKAPKILKLKKEKILKASKDQRKTRVTKRGRKYSLNQNTSSFKTLQSICVDFLNTSCYRNYAREQLSISRKFSKMKVLKDFKKKFNFDGMKQRQSTPLINQKFNHSVRVNSLREMCGKLLSNKAKLLELDGSEENEFYHCDNVVPSLKELCTSILSDMNVSVVNLFTPSSLKDICESYIYSNRQYFLIEEVSDVPKLQDLCKDTLSASNIFVNIESNANNVYEAIEEEVNADGEPIYIVEENSGNVGELFESDTLNPHEKSEILRKIQRVTVNIDDDDEIIRAIGALHDEDDDNNNINVYNKNISLIDDIEDDMSYLKYTNGDELNVQYEEIISVNNRGGEKMRKIFDILRHKYLNRSDIRQATRTINRILRKSLIYQRVHRHHNAQRKERINSLIQQARCALFKLKRLNCDNITPETVEIDSPDSDIDDDDDDDEDDDVMFVNKNHFESHENAKDHHQVTSDYQESPESPTTSSSSTTTISDSSREAEEQYFPKLPIVFPSINEYKIERKGNHRYNGDVSVKDNDNVTNNSNFAPKKKRKMSFDESLLFINKIYRKKSENDEMKCHEKRQTSSHGCDRRMSMSSRYHSSRNHSSYDDRHRDRNGRERRRSRSRSRSHSRHHSRRMSSERDRESSRNSYHNSSRHDHYRKDQNNKHSEARRLVLPRYKLYDKDLDVKLKVRPYVRIEREERVDDMVKKYN